MFITGMCLHIYGQVGIHTSTPKSSLHVNGDMTLTSSFNVGGSSDTAGNPGNKNEILQSQGVGLPPIWKTADAILNPNSFVVTQSTSIFLPLGFNMAWQQVPGLSQGITIPQGKKALVIISGQQCFQQTLNQQKMTGISIGLFDGNGTSPLISFTGQLIWGSVTGLVSEFTLLPISYSEFIDASSAAITRTYNVKARINYAGGTTTNDIRAINDPYGRGDYSQLRVSILTF